MDSKKISFGFKKTKTKTNLFGEHQREEQKIDLIKCVEGQKIKLFIEKTKESPLVIKMKKNENSGSALVHLKRSNISLGDEKLYSSDPNCPTNSKKNNLQFESIEKRAEYELLNEVHDKDKATEVPSVIASNSSQMNEPKDSTFEDYESIPIEQFGMAMLRGMGWVEPKSKDCKTNNVLTMRAKGMGLGADKALQQNKLVMQPEDNEILQIKKKTFVRVLGGKHKDAYGQIEGFDDQSSRVIVKMAIGGGKESFNEFLCQPVSKNEYKKYGKCINTKKYEMFKEMENEHEQIELMKQVNTNSKSITKCQPIHNIKNMRRSSTCSLYTDRKSNLVHKKIENVLKNDQYCRTYSSIEEEKHKQRTFYKKIEKEKKSKHRSTSRSSHKHSND